MTAPIRFYQLDQLSSAQRTALLRRTESDLSEYIAAVQPIIAAVRQDGDHALIHYTREFDQADVAMDRIQATPEDFTRAYQQLEPELIQAIEYAVDNIRRFHQAQKPEEMWLKEIRPGMFGGEKWLPIPSVALYVPRGKGSFPSMVMMSAIPAAVADVSQICIITPPGPDGEIDAATLVAAQLSGVQTVYKCGGAQGIAAVAFGTETVPKVSKVVGPGSPYVLAAKRVLADIIDPGIPAGPSESIVLADHTANAAIAALDLIIESEHGADSSAYLITDCAELAQTALAKIPEYWSQMGQQRVDYSAAVLAGPRGGVILAPDMDTAIQFVNDYAPEHLQILAQEPMQYLGKIQNAGEILLGEHTPSVIANYLLGPNAILPTGGAATTVSPLSVFDFMKRSSIGYITATGYTEPARHTHVLATYEGFDGHANAVSELREQALK